MNGLFFGKVPSECKTNITAFSMWNGERIAFEERVEFFACQLTETQYSLCNEVVVEENIFCELVVIEVVFGAIQYEFPPPTLYRPSSSGSSASYYRCSLPPPSQVIAFCVCFL